VGSLRRSAALGADPCWTWRARPEPESGRHRVSGRKVILVGMLSGHLAWGSGPVDGSRHDIHCLGESDLLEGTDPSFSSGDTGFIGAGMITPIRKRNIATSWTGRKIQHRDRQIPAGHRTGSSPTLKTWRINQAQSAPGAAALVRVS
jgi:hypothetical protein